MVYSRWPGSNWMNDKLISRAAALEECLGASEAFVFSDITG